MLFTRNTPNTFFNDRVPDIEARTRFCQPTSTRDHHIVSHCRMRIIGRKDEIVLRDTTAHYHPFW
ncbi:MAG: hypothetical protein H0W33_13290 [Gammaproteobacteria bacterium]|nr:hypothetical protein [Gammaproteobacteria bacterium]